MQLYQEQGGVINLKDNNYKPKQLLTKREKEVFELLYKT